MADGPQQTSAWFEWETVFPGPEPAGGSACRLPLNNPIWLRYAEFDVIGLRAGETVKATVLVDGRDGRRVVAETAVEGPTGPILGDAPPEFRPHAGGEWPSRALEAGEAIQFEMTPLWTADGNPAKMRVVLTYEPATVKPG